MSKFKDKNLKKKQTDRTLNKDSSRDLFNTLSDIYNGAFSRKKLKAFILLLFLLKSSVIDDRPLSRTIIDNSEQFQWDVLTH